MISRGYILPMRENKRQKITVGIQKLCKRGHGSSSPSTKQPVTMATDQSQHIVYIPELLKCRTIIVVNFN